MDEARREHRVLFKRKYFINLKHNNNYWFLPLDYFKTGTVPALSVYKGRDDNTILVPAFSFVIGRATNNNYMVPAFIGAFKGRDSPCQ